MPHPIITLAQTPSLSSLIGIAVTPVTLITATAILLSGFSSKYSSISDQMRHMTAEYRKTETTTTRRISLKRQLGLLHRRISAMWAASTMLSLALLSFLGTVLAVFFAQREARIGPFGIATLLIGLSLVSLAVGLELYEIGLARLTTAGEIADIFTSDEAEHTA